jgi:iron complex transport system permease protein
LGEAEAGHLGINVETTKRLTVVLVALAVGAAVSVSGTIGFIGLVVPHLIRLLVGPDHRIVLPGSALLGAFLLLVADLLARTVAVPAEVPIGILTAVLGGPFFLWLLVRRA